APFDDIDPAGLVAAVAVVVAGEEVAVVVERQFLRIAQTGGEFFQVRAIQVAAEHGAALRIRKVPVPLADVVAAVADAEIELAVGADDQPMHVVAAEGIADAIAFAQYAALVAPTVAVAVDELVQLGNVREIDLAAIA